jgi:hypothetical protein
LRSGLADVELSADRAHPSNSIRPELPGDQLGRLLPQRVRVVLGAGMQSAGTWELRITIMRSSYEPISATAGHAAIAAPVRP